MTPLFLLLPVLLLSALSFVAVLFILALAALLTAFWVWMLVDCASNETNEGNDKLVWILILIFTHWIGALIYYLVRRPQRLAAANKAKGVTA